ATGTFDLPAEIFSGELAEGNYTVLINNVEGYQPIEEEVNVDASGDNDFTFTLQPVVVTGSAELTVDFNGATLEEDERACFAATNVDTGKQQFTFCVGPDEDI